MQITKTCNRLICLLLSCIMVIQIMPLSIFAAESSGICGGGVTWHLDGDVLYIEGEGEMYDFLAPRSVDDDPNDHITYVPWSGGYVSKIVIEEGITYIGNFAFYEMYNVVEVELPSTLKGIGSHAFSYMRNLEEAILPEGLTTMGIYAFSACNSLYTVYIPSTLKVIPSNAFWQCTSLTDLIISYGVEEIGEGAFSGCSGIGAEGDGMNDPSTMFDGPGLQYVEIPGSVKTIGGGAFTACSMLREVILHEGIERIGSGAFNNCNSLYDVTLPSSLKTMGEWVFDHLGGSLDFKLEEQGIPVTRLQNVYILSRELSMYAPVEYETDTPMPWFNEWRPFAMFHVYEDSVAAQEIAEYNENITDEYTSALNYSYIPDCGHGLTAFVSDDENTHTRTCVDENCTASQTVRHTLTVDLDNLTMGDCETALNYRLYCTACDYVGEFVTKEAAGHEISGYYYYCDEEYHEGYCWNCYEYVLKPHNWEYEEDLSATEPYEVEAYCAACGTTKTITAFPAEATIISLKAKDENGADAALPEDSFTVRWEDSDGNILANGTTYVHNESWIVSEERPVFAVISFSDEVREAYSVSGEIRHKVTELGQRSEFVLVPRELLTVTGRVMIDGYTYPPVDSLSLTLTTEIAGNESVQTVTPDSSGYFTAQIRRAPTRLDYAARGYERVVLENVQMIPAADGVIDVGTLTLANQMAWYYPTVESSDYAAVAEELVGASLIAVNERTGEEYTGARIERHGDFALAISFGMDMDKYFKIGDSVTIRCAQMDAVIFDPYTFTITNEDEQVPLDITVYKAPKLEIKLSRQGHIFLFDSEDNLVCDVLRTTYSSFLPRDTYTLVAFSQNYRMSSIDSPDALERIGISSEYYLKETIDLTEDVTLKRELPGFYYGGELAIAASFDTTMQTDGLVPMYLNFSHVFKETYAEGETIEFTFSPFAVKSLPIQSIQGTCAFGTDELGLTERIITDKTDTLVVTASQPHGTILLYVKPTGESLHIQAKTSAGAKDYLTLHLPSLNVTMMDPAPSGWTTNADSFVTLYAKLPKDQAPYTGYLYVNGELESEKELKITGEGRNYLNYTLERYTDGASTHDFYVEILDKDGELVWISENYMVTLINSSFSNTIPKMLTIRTHWQAGHGNTNYLSVIDLQKNPGASFSVPVYEDNINTDGTLKVDAVFDYALRMSDNSVAIKDNTVYMKVFCGEDNPVPTIHDIKLRYNGETGTYDGTLTLEANTYTIRDLPYGYSFEYSMGAGGGSGFYPSTAGPSGVSFSVKQLTDQLEDKASEYLEAQDREVYEYFDPDKLEFLLANMEDISVEDKEMFRILTAIGNDRYSMQNDAIEIGKSIANEICGEEIIADSPAEAILRIVGAVGSEIRCEPIDPSIDYSTLGYIPIDTFEIGEKLGTELDNFYLNVDTENGKIIAVDTNTGLMYSTEFTPPSAPDPVSTFSLSRQSATTFSSSESYEEYVKMVMGNIFDAATGMTDMLIDKLKDIRDYYQEQYDRKYGDMLEGYEDAKQKVAAAQKTNDQWKARVTELEAQIKPTGNINPDEFDSMFDYVKKAAEINDENLKLAAEINRLDNAIGQAEDIIKDMRNKLQTMASAINRFERVSVESINRYTRGLKLLESTPVKFAFFAVDFIGGVMAVADACIAYNNWLGNKEWMKYEQERAIQEKNKLDNACAADKTIYLEQRDKCFDAYFALLQELDDAENLNDYLFGVRIGASVCELGSIAAGYFLKGPQGVIVGLELGLISGVTELAVEEMLNSSKEDVHDLQKRVLEDCREPLNDPGIVDKDCDDDDTAGEDDDHTGGIPGYSNGLGICEEPQYPVKTNTTIDPAGYVYEAVASNRIEGATAKIYYEAKNGEEVYWSEAEDYGEINPHTTGMDGRFAWMTPIGNWLVKAEKDGYLPADSKNDPAAVNGWLPVPPPQLDVNIPMISTAVPTVLSAGAASDQIRVVFSQYMDIAQIKEGLVTVIQNGQPISVDIVFEDAEVNPTNDAVYYGRIMKLTRTDGTAFSGDGIKITVDSSAQNYAGTALGTDYTSGSLAVTQLIGSLSHSYPNRFVTDIGKDEQIAVQVLDTNGKPMAGVTVTARQTVGGTLEMNESAVSDVSGRAVFTVKGLSAGSDIILFEADVVSTEMNTRVSPLGNKAPQKPIANLTDYEVVEKGTQLVLECATEGAVIYYTTNNTCPCTDSAERKTYNGPIEITEDTFFRIAAWTEVGGYSERLNLHIMVETPRYGDVNNDGQVDNADSILLKEYFAGYSVVINEEFADVNRDGAVTRADAMILARHFAGWNGYSLPYQAGS